VRVLSSTNPKNRPCKCCVASLIAVNFIGECAMVVKTLPFLIDSPKAAPRYCPCPGYRLLFNPI
jgi:hypothetical protein